ncbi:MAG TPA: SDR family NAD(P)-dependent oxidoreductase [Solirubrobacterales bacterium]|nr:SDR family NAD(P)-dependent oxidoreductase [Solirubrobacterales bacterium]
MSGGRLEGKRALITGAGSGIGAAMVELFAAEGAAVAAVGRRESSIERWSGVDGVVAVRADLTEGEEIVRMVAEAERQIGPLDAVCNVAGINDLCYPLHETSDQRWDAVVDLDLKVPFQVCRAAIDGMVERGGGAILNVGSGASVRGNHGPAYTAAKAGLNGLTMSIAVAYGGSGVRCNVLNPGEVNNTEISSTSGGEYHPGGLKMWEDIVAKLPVKWDCEPEEIARVALFLCSDDAAHVNGAVVAVDGGMSVC